MSGVMQTTYDGAGSVVGEADFNIFREAAYAKTKSLQTLNGVNSGFTSRICGGPRRGFDGFSEMWTGMHEDARNRHTTAADYIQGTNSSQPNQGGGGYTIWLTRETHATATRPSNDVSSISVLHFYISAFGVRQLPGSSPPVGISSFAECCNDPNLDMVMHIPTVNCPATGNVERKASA